MSASIDAANAIVGTPFMFGGRDIGTQGALDCVGVVLAYYKIMGHEIPDPATVDVNGVLASSFAAHFAKIDKRRATVGDVVRYDHDSGAHLGVIVERGRMLHACRVRGACVAAIPIGSSYYRLRQGAIPQCS